MFFEIVFVVTFIHTTHTHTPKQEPPVTNMAGDMSAERRGPDMEVRGAGLVGMELLHWGWLSCGGSQLRGLCLVLSR